MRALGGFAWLFMASCLMGCGTAQELKTPAALRTSNNVLFIGSSSGILPGGKFEFVEAGGSGLRCFGEYKARAMSGQFTQAFECTDGRTGEMSLTIDGNGTEARGTAVLSDGSVAVVALGPSAEFTVRTAQVDPAAIKKQVAVPAASPYHGCLPLSTLDAFSCALGGGKPGSTGGAPDAD